MLNTFIETFSELADPRVHVNKNRHKLIDVIVLAICGVVCGSDDWTGIELYAKNKFDWFNTFLELPGGIPSHDTFGRIFSLIDPEVFQQCFVKWTKQVATISNGQVVAIDGKTLRRSHDGNDKAAIHMVSAWATENRLVLAQVKTDEKSNEITAIPELLELFDVKGAIVTIDAMGAQRKIANKIVDKGGDYVLGLKANQPTLLAAVEDKFGDIDSHSEESPELKIYQTKETNRDRSEVRTHFITDNLIGINKDLWPGLISVGLVISQVTRARKTSTERRYYIASIKPDAKQFAEAVRSHWGIENSLHWVLDVAFREDDSRVRKGNGPQNLAVLRHIALNILRSDKSVKAGVKNKRLTAGWNNDYLARLLFNH